MLMFESLHCFCTLSLPTRDFCSMCRLDSLPIHNPELEQVQVRSSIHIGFSGLNLQSSSNQPMHEEHSSGTAASQSVPQSTENRRVMSNKSSETLALAAQSQLCSERGSSGSAISPNESHCTQTVRRGPLSSSFSAPWPALTGRVTLACLTQARLQVGPSFWSNLQ
jgi:hypothetical protein